MNYVTIDTVTDVLGADWATSGDGNTAVLLANAWLNEKRLTLYDDVVPDSILHAGAYIAKEVIAGNMYQGRKDGIVVSKSVKAGPVTSSKTFAAGADGQALSAGESMALALIAPFKTTPPLIIELGRY